MKSLIRSLLTSLGYEIRRLPKPVTAEERHIPDVLMERARALVQAGVRKAHYGSAGILFAKDWVNLDFSDEPETDAHYLKTDLTEKHPFPDGWLSVGYAEDFLEHLDQEQSLRFLIEVHRTLQPGGVVRLSFPGLEGVLRKHYTPATFGAACIASTEAYDMWGHRHFYSREELKTVAAHIGFREVRFCEFGVSPRPELNGLDRRSGQTQLNTYAELVN
jgi:predicted SAM-dependent methyltransferase